MSFAPRHDWTYYEERTSKYDLHAFQSMGQTERFRLYADMYNTIMEMRQRMHGDSEGKDYLWEEKVSLRMKMLLAFRLLEKPRIG